MPLNPSRDLTLKIEVALEPAEVLNADVEELSVKSADGGGITLRLLPRSSV
jgi:hypothetical protein